MNNNFLYIISFCSALQPEKLKTGDFRLDLQV